MAKNTKKTDKTDVSVNALTKNVEKKAAKKTEKKDKKGKTAVRYTRDMAVNDCIKKMGKTKKGFTFQELLDASDAIMVSKGAKSNPTAFNVNKYILTGLLSFGIVKTTKKVDKVQISHKKDTRYILA